MSRLKNKTAFVTGGSRGIGAGIVRQLAAEGANIIFTYVHSEQKSSELVKEIEAMGVKAMAVKADTGNENAISKAIEQASEWGIDILVNSSGLFITGEIDNKDSDLSAFKQQWDVNVHGVVHTLRNALPYMKNGSRIISIGSTGASRSAYPGIGDYAATKAALAAYTRSWARDLGSRNITVNIIQPGLINTDMNPADGPFSSQMLQSIALGHYGEPKDIGAAVAFLASDDARYITGVTLNVDGGQTT
jgi:3-oxoacyl-[acyl-carrier protein] reductase